MRWGIVGTGDMAAKFVVALQGTPGAEVALVASRSGDRAAAFARRLGVPQAIEGYDAAARADVDVVYIATPPSEHLANALTFLAAGKPVVIEKPFAATAQQATELADAARAAGVFCMEGLWTRFMPALTVARRLLADGAIGAPRAFAGSFAVADAPDPAGSAGDPALGGRALAHRGVYPISLALHLLGPATLSGAALTRDARGVDEEVSAILRHDSGATSTIYAGSRTTAANDLTLLGDRGRMVFQGPIYRPHGVRVTAVRPRSRAGGGGRFARLKETAFAQEAKRRVDALRKLAHADGGKTFSAPPQGNGYRHQIEAVAQCLRDGLLEHPLMTLDQSIATARLMDDIRALDR